MQNHNFELKYWKDIKYMLSKAPSYSTATSSYSCKTDIETQNKRDVKAELLQVGIFSSSIYLHKKFYY